MEKSIDISSSMEKRWENASKNTHTIGGIIIPIKINHIRTLRGDILILHKSVINNHNQGYAKKYLIEEKFCYNASSKNFK